VREAFLSKPASSVRTVELLVNSLVQLPSWEQVTRYSQIVEESLKEWAAQYPQLDRHLPAVEELLEQVRLFYPFLQTNSSGGKDARS
jgi:hypothetical protein